VRLSLVNRFMMACTKVDSIAMICICAILTFALIGSANIDAAEVTPDQLEFRRQAVLRIIFDRLLSSSSVSLTSALYPKSIYRMHAA